VEWQFTVDDHLLRRVAINQTKNTTLLKNGIAGLRGTLFPYQSEGVSFIDAHNGRALIADEMGLGKTIQALAWLQLHPEARPAVIVTPASLKLNWEREARQWMTLPDTHVVFGSFPYELRSMITIINYDIVTRWVSTILESKPKVIILDECHLIKNDKALRTRAVQQLARSIPNIITLSGTPMLSRPAELYNALNLVCPALFNNKWHYYQRYCGAHRGPFGWNFNGATHTKELHDILTSSCMLRRLKVDVLPQLPPKISSFVPMELDSVEEYRSAERDFIDYIQRTRGNEAARRASRAEAFARVEVLKQVVAAQKLNSVLHWIDEFLSEDIKLVVFAHHNDIVEQIYQAFAPIAVRYDGTLSAQAKEQAKDRFQTDPNVRLFIGSLKAAGIGLTLTAASHVAFVELPWTASDLDQCTDRLHRIGQAATSVNIYYLLATDTIEEHVAAIVDGKRTTFDAVMDGRATSESSMISALIAIYETQI